MGQSVIGDAFRRLKQRRRQARAMREIAARPAGPGCLHGLDAPLIVSLTSFPARFATLRPTLLALTRQTVQPDQVILWLEQHDLAQLPPAIRDMDGLSVRTCPAWRSYGKIIPTLLAHPDAFIATADDDIHYAPDWLEGLVGAAGSGARVASHRAHGVVMQAAGPAPYESWQHNLDRPQVGPLVFPTGVSGAIYAPGVFHPDVTRDDLFQRLAPGADDIWLYWMHRMAGSSPVKIGGRNRILEWAGSQDVSLRAVNRSAQGTGGNDRAIAALTDRYGWPG